jgi:hypothetical protein
MKPADFFAPLLYTLRSLKIPVPGLNLSLTTLGYCNLNEENLAPPATEYKLDSYGQMPLNDFPELADIAGIGLKMTLYSRRLITWVALLWVFTNQGF